MNKADNSNENLKSFHKDLKEVKSITIPANTLKVGDVLKLGDVPMFDPTKKQYITITIKEVMENKKEPLMSSEEWYESETKQGYCFIDMFDFAYLYSDYLLSHHINVLAERIADNAEAFDALNPEYPKESDVKYISIVSRGSVLKIAKDYINELNLQSSK